MLTIAAYAIAGLLITSSLRYRLKVNPVMASALPAAVVSIAVLLLSGAYPDQASHLETLAAAFFGATFVGMSSERALDSMARKGIAGLIFSAIFYAAQQPHGFSGIGGGLGTAAMISVIATIGLAAAVAKFRPGAG